MRLLATGLMLMLAGVVAAQDAPKKKKKKTPKPFKWVNKLPANGPKEVAACHLQEPVDGSGGGLLYLPAAAV